MKFSTFVTASAFVLVSSFASAKTAYVVGTVAGVNTAQQTISVVSSKDDQVITYKYASDVEYRSDLGKKRDLEKLQKGEKVKLKIEAAK